MPTRIGSRLLSVLRSRARREPQSALRAGEVRVVGTNASDNDPIITQQAPIPQRPLPSPASQPPMSAPSPLTAACGALLGMSALSWPFLLAPAGASEGLYTLASFGSTACLVFAAPAAPFSQPRNVLLGHLASSIAGLGVSKAAALAGFAAPASSVLAPVAVAAAVGAMVAGRCVHPPAAGTAIIAMLTPLPPETFLPLVAAQSSLVVGVGASFARARSTPQDYPARWWG